MIKVGIYIDNPNPEEGGASSLLTTIREGISEYARDSKYEFVYLFNGGRKYPYKTKIDSTEFINVNRAFDMHKWKVRVEKIRYILKPWKILDYMYGELDSHWERIGKNEKIDLFWFTSPIIAYTSIPYIFTVWDIGHRVLPQFPEMSSPLSEWYGRENVYQKMLYRASYVITGNETGKKELLENYPVPKNKIRVIQFPVSSFCEGPEEKPDIGLPDMFFFYPAQFWPHKNHVCIIKAIKILKDYGIKVYFVFCGSDHGNEKHVRRLACQYGIDDQIIFAGFVTYPELKYLYTHATAMVYASLLGPNNIPPLEAVYLGCPVIITDLDGHKEQLGDSAMYFGGYDPKELADRIEQMLNADNRDYFVKKSRNLRSFLKEYLYMSEVELIFREFYEMQENWG